MGTVEVRLTRAEMRIVYDGLLWYDSEAGEEVDGLRDLIDRVISVAAGEKWDLTISDGNGR